jgi:phage antirepressor YoqD-like protein
VGKNLHLSDWLSRRLAGLVVYSREDRESGGIQSKSFFYPQEDKVTTRETAQALGVTERTIQRHAKELGLTENGMQTELDEKAVTIIKKKIERSGRTDLDNVVELPNVSTDLEMMVLDAKVSEWKTRKIEELQKQLEGAKHKLEFYDSVADSTDTVDIGTVAKVLMLPYGRNTLFSILRDKKILMSDNKPYQEYMNRGYFKIIEEPYNKNGNTFIGFKTVVFQKGLEYIKKVVSE